MNVRRRIVCWRRRASCVGGLGDGGRGRGNRVFMKLGNMEGWHVGSRHWCWGWVIAFFVVTTHRHTLSAMFLPFLQGFSVSVFPASEQWHVNIDCEHARVPREITALAVSNVLKGPAMVVKLCWKGWLVVPLLPVL